MSKDLMDLIIISKELMRGKVLVKNAQKSLKLVLKRHRTASRRARNVSIVLKYRLNDLKK